MKGRFLWSRHALREAVEDSFKPSDVERALEKCVIVESGLGKQKAICKVNKRYCTIVFVKMEFGFKIVTCWKSSEWEIRVFNEEVKK